MAKTAVFIVGAILLTGWQTLRFLMDKEVDLTLRGNQLIESRQSLDSLATQGFRSFDLNGDLFVQQSTLVDLVGLEQLQRLWGTLRIRHNNTLINLINSGSFFIHR